MQALEKIEEQTISENDNFHLVAFRDGDQGVFKLVYDRISKPLLYFVSNIIDSQPDAEDIVASAFLKLYRARESMQSFDHIKRWLYVIVRNEAIDYLRFKARSREVHQDLGSMGEVDEEQVDLEMLKSGLLQSLWEAIERLPPQRKAVLQLYFFAHKTTSEIAEQLQLNSQTVLNHKTRALESLRKTVFMPNWFFSGILGLLLEATFFLMK
jgi:RNA polymerase sigma-70 factor (family 1)